MSLKRLLGASFQVIGRIPGHKRLVAPLAKRFFAGEKVNDALADTRFFNGLGFNVIIGYVGEDTKTIEEVLIAEAMYHGIVRQIKKLNLRADISLKPSQYRVDDMSRINAFTWQEDYAELASVLELAGKMEIHSWFDAERLKVRRATWQIGKHALSATNSFIGIAFQAYGTGEFNSLEFCENNIADFAARIPQGKTLGIRLCMGAYDEKQALKDEVETHTRYLELADLLIKLALKGSSGKQPTLFLEFATHEPTRIEPILTRTKEFGLPRTSYRIAMLRGRQPDYASHLLTEGENVAIYIPFGPLWFPYFGRRIQENPDYLLLPFKKEGTYHACPEWAKSYTCKNIKSRP